MCFVCVCVGCVQIWYCDGFLYQNLFRITQGGEIMDLYQWYYSNNNEHASTCSVFEKGDVLVVICDLSYEHNCDLCSELQGLVLEELQWQELVSVSSSSCAGGVTGLPLHIMTSYTSLSYYG